MSFDERLIRGKVAESAIARWLMRKGWAVLPAYEVETGSYKGPQFYRTNASFATPDMLACRHKDERWTTAWIEAKHKTAFSWYRIGGYWCTGIDLRNYMDYQSVAIHSPWPVWLLFLHRGGQAKDSPAESPSGLYGHKLEHLVNHESHRSERHAGGMVYWAESTLSKIAELEEVISEDPTC